MGEQATGGELQRGRVIRLDRGFPLIRLEDGTELRCRHATALLKGEDVRAVIGDAVLCRVEDDADMAEIQEILPRSSEFVRRDPGERSLPQVLAANFDAVVIAHPLADLNLSRLEREFVLAQSTGARVICALTKSDLVEDAAERQGLVDQARGIAPTGVPVLAVSHADGTMGLLAEQLREGGMAVLIGRSGAGKSSLVNQLAGAAVAQTGAVREGDGKGRHTTVARTIIDVPGCGSIVDMPGVRGLGLWESEDGINLAFPEFAAHLGECRFRDCTHDQEPDCALRAAVERGEASPQRLESYLRLFAEVREQREKKEEARRAAKGRPVPKRARGRYRGGIDV